MAFTIERDDLDQEIQRAIAGEVLRFYPKDEEGKNVTASSVAADNTVTIYDRRGKVMTASANLPAPVVDAGQSRFDVPVTTDTTWLYEYGYEARIVWRISGETADRRSVVRFGVVARRWMTDISLNDLQSKVSWIDEPLTTIASRLGLSNAAAAAAIFAYEARTELERWLNARSVAEGRTRATLIVDRLPLRALMRDKALALILRASAKRATPGDRHWDYAELLEREYLGGLQGLGPLDYDSDQDMVADTTRNPGLVLLSR